MFKEFIEKVLSVAFFATACELIIPEGGLKKYFKLSVGFIMMCTIMYPLTNIVRVPSFEFNFDYAMSEEEIRAESNAYILKMHEDNIEARVKEICGNDVKVFVSLAPDGTVEKVTLRGTCDNSHITRIKNEIGCENIRIIGGEDYEN